MNSHPDILFCGALVRADEARLHVQDRGFRFGDGVFESLRICAGVPYQWELHCTRLQRGLEALRITPPMIDWASHARKLLHHHAMREGMLRISVSRGVGSLGYLPTHEGPPTWVMEIAPLSTLNEGSAKPYTLHLSGYQRPSLSSMPVNFKLAHGITSTLALLEARDYGCADALMLSAGGHVCETASANLFWISEGIVFTPPLTSGCLEGTTRQAILRLLPNIREVEAPLEALTKAEAIFTSNARRGIIPIIGIHGKPWQFDVGHTQIQSLQQALLEDQRAYIAAHQTFWHS